MRCPTCDSPDPARHPAVQFEGEVEICRDPFHAPAPVAPYTVDDFARDLGPRAKFPLRWTKEQAAAHERGLLRAALVGLVGVDGREELEYMEAVMRALPAPAADKAAAIDAIHALLATLDSPPAADAVARGRDDGTV